MNKATLCETIARRVGVSKKQAEEVLDALEAIVYETLQARGEVTLTGFGTFSARVRSARMGVNPQKPSERIHVPEVVIPKFKSGKAFKDALKSKKAATAEENPSS